MMNQTTNESKNAFFQNHPLRWSDRSGGYYEISPSHATGSCLDVSGASTADGAIVQLWQYLSGNNQQWSPQAP